MATVSGYIGSAGTEIQFNTPKSLNVTMPSNTYPNGTIVFENVRDYGAYWHNSSSSRKSIDLYLCDGNGNNAVRLFTLSIAADASEKGVHTATISGATGLAGKALYLKATGDETALLSIKLRNRTTVSIGTAVTTRTITCQVGSAGGGKLTASKTSAVPGETITLNPVPNTGWKLTSYESSPSVTITNNRFVMPASNVTITANFNTIDYNLIKKTSPSGGGTVSATRGGVEIDTAKADQTVALGFTANDGYLFDSWSLSPSRTVTNDRFVMPASNVTITAKVLRRSTGSLDKGTLTGGGTAKLTISADKTAFSHSYRLALTVGGTTHQTDLVRLDPGVKTATVNVPTDWYQYLPNDTYTNTLSLILYTYKNATQDQSTRIGSYTIENLRYEIPSNVIPVPTPITLERLLTVGGVTYADLGVYVQNHSGVRIQVGGSATGGASIATIRAYLNGYSGASYDKTVTTSSINFSTGLLTQAGTQTITVVLTDSRGRTSTVTTSITVAAYAAPKGTLKVYRVDSSGQDDPSGTYGWYELTKKISTVGNNALQSFILRSRGTNKDMTGKASTGFLLPDNQQTFDDQTEYKIRLTLTDKLETTVITATMQTSRFIFHIDEDGDHLGIMKAGSKTTPAGKNNTVEFSGDSQIYIGNDTLEGYIKDNAMAAISIPSSTDLNTLTTPGNYYAEGSTLVNSLSNCPTTQNFGMQVIPRGASNRAQIIYIGTYIYTRVNTSNGWGSWYRYAGTAV